MTINPILFGVLSTIGVELLALLIVVIHLGTRQK